MIIDENLMCSFKVLKPESEVSKSEKQKIDKNY